MSILVKPYEISVWEDVLDEDGQLTEKRLAIIGSDKMLGQNRAIEPTLTRNVNGTKNFSFKMYKTYIDNVTGQKVVNPYSNWLTAERKIKLKYATHIDDSGVATAYAWYDFIIKNVVETSIDYLYSYQMEDALVQELSKNGFGVTLDEKLMNNIGDAKELGEKVLAETNWSVDSEVFVQTVDEALVYVQIPGGTIAKHILDQSDDNLDVGITIENEDYEFTEDSMVLAFYSCCKNKPHRFQFIYSSDGYGKDSNGLYKISRGDDRTINQANCQYYIDFETPETIYLEPNAENNSEDLGLYLPEGFGLGSPGVKEDDSSDQDSYLSSWYRGKRYGFAPQSVYVPQLDRYCQKYQLNEAEEINLDGDEVGEKIKGYILGIPTVSKNDNNEYSFVGNIPEGEDYKHAGFYFDSSFINCYAYELKYKINISSGTLKTIGGHNRSFITSMEVKYDGNTYYTNSDIYEFDNEITAGEIEVVARYIKKEPETQDDNPYIFIQPNKYYTEAVSFSISNLTLKKKTSFLGYTESNYVSPTLVQNFINNYNFESSGGWTGASSGGANKAIVESVYGRFTDNFISIIDDFSSGNYSDETPYASYMHIKFPSEGSFILNSGIRDNRATIKNMPEGEEWVLDYKILDSGGDPITVDNFNWSLSEYIYDTTNHVYTERGSHIDIQISEEKTVIDDYGTTRIVFTVQSSGYTENSFKKDSKIYLKISSSDLNSDFYIGKIALYKKSLNSSGNIISPDDTETSLVNNSVVENKYYYFNSWLVDNNNRWAITNQEELLSIVSSTLAYDTFIPEYNEGAKKIRSVTAKESNYFNILQNIAETFEAWLDFEIIRDSSTGSVSQKKVKFKNYIGANNPINFRYGVNLKDIQRTSGSKNIVTKLIVKNNSNQNAENGSCTIQRADANPTGENYIYDFQYYQNMGIMNTEDYLSTVYYIDGAQGKDGVLWGEQVTTDDRYNLKGYYQRIKKINDTLEPINERYNGLIEDLVQKKADLDVARMTYESSVSDIEQIREDFLALTGVYPGSSVVVESIEFVEIVRQEDWYSIGDEPTTNGTEISFVITPNEADEEDRELEFTFKIRETTTDGVVGLVTYKLNTTIPGDSTEAITLTKDCQRQLDFSRTDITKYLTKYSTYDAKCSSSSSQMTSLEGDVDDIQEAMIELQTQRNNLIEYKKQLNNLFFTKYSRYIQEGTWISEEYVDDDKYYADAQSVLYSSCYPQVTYTINVFSLSGLKGYENFVFELGDKTSIIDNEFFGAGKKEEVIISEMVEVLDDPSKSQIKVQNFKNQFQDLFQKITATVQQTQYNSGSYERGAALFEANVQAQSEFITNAINSATTFLSPSKKHDVVIDDSGITITDIDIPTNQVKLVGGAILLSIEDPNTKEQTWRTGITNEGISADLITAGRLDTGVIQIMSGDEPVFRWDAYGISAYDAVWSDGEVPTISGINTKKFVRFDKNGIYGINDFSGVDGASWYPNNIGEIDQAATFALTWEGLKVTGNGNVVARLGKLDGHILQITDAEGNGLMSFSNDGTLSVGTWSVDQRGLVSVDLDPSPEPQTYSLRRTAQPLTREAAQPAIPKIFLVPDPITLDLSDYEFATSETNKDIVFKAGDNFLVAEDGELYAKSGRIGSMDIDDLFSGDVNSSFSWQFSPTEGIKMWRGPQSDEYLVFSVNGMENEYRGSLKIQKDIDDEIYKCSILSNISLITQPVFSITKNDDPLLNINMNGFIETPYYSINSTGIISKNATSGLLFRPAKTLEETDIENIHFKNRTGKVGEDYDTSFYYYSAQDSGSITFNIYLEKAQPSHQYYKAPYVVYTYTLDGYETNKTMYAASDGESITSNILTFSDTFSAYGTPSSVSITCWLYNDYSEEYESYNVGYFLRESTRYTWIETKRLPWNGSITCKETPTISLESCGSFAPGTPNEYNLGSSGKKWLDIFAVNSTIGGSDINEKEDILPLMDTKKYETFYDNIKPLRYKWKINQSNRYHIGFGSQYIRDNLLEAGLTTKDFAGYVEWDNEDNTKGYGLRYGEFIALNTWQIQKTKTRVSTLEQIILDYEARIANLETEIQNLKS